jgi:hypothetical protein
LKRYKNKTHINKKENLSEASKEKEDNKENEVQSLIKPEYEASDTVENNK